MPASASPQLRFLLRASFLFIVLLALWWWLLLGPMMTALRFSTGAALWMMPGGGSASGAILAPDGGWILRVPIPQVLGRQDAVQRAYGRAPGGPPVAVRSFRLAIAERIPTFFTLGFPLFWALMLAAPRSRAGWRAAAIGTALLALLAQLSLLFYAAYSIQSTLRLATGALAVTLWNGLEYLNINVAPYMAPLLIGLWLHPGLRAQIFSWNDVEPQPATVPVVEPEKSRRGRSRG
jgi:hypothetical protein